MFSCVGRALVFGFLPTIHPDFPYLNPSSPGFFFRFWNHSSPTSPGFFLSLPWFGNPSLPPPTSLQTVDLESNFFEKQQTHKSPRICPGKRPKRPSVAVHGSGALNITRARASRTIIPSGKRKRPVPATVQRAA